MRGRPAGAVNGHLGPAIPISAYEVAKDRNIEEASAKLLRRMLKLGAKSGGCLDLSAAQCRARLEMIA